jgi:hypothetical protein
MAAIKPKKDENGFWYYDQVPENFRQASREDFFTDDGKLIIEKPYLIKSHHFNKVEAHRTKAGFDVDNLLPWLDERRVYVLKD